MKKKGGMSDLMEEVERGKEKLINKERRQFWETIYRDTLGKHQQNSSVIADRALAEWDKRWKEK